MPFLYFIIPGIIFLIWGIRKGNTYMRTKESDEA